MCVLIIADCFAIASVNTLVNNGLECANGNFVANWNGCIDQGSVRVRCPKAHLPCNDLAGNGTEFSCWNDCATHGGIKDCFAEGTFNYRIYSIIQLTIRLQKPIKILQLD